MISQEAKDEILVWVDTQITFNLDKIDSKTSYAFFSQWQKKHLPIYPYIVIHQTINHSDIRCQWHIYFYVSSVIYDLHTKHLFESPDCSLGALWWEFLVEHRDPKREIVITADTVNHINITCEK